MPVQATAGNREKKGRCKTRGIRNPLPFLKKMLLFPLRWLRFSSHAPMFAFSIVLCPLCDVVCRRCPQKAHPQPSLPSPWPPAVLPLAHYCASRTSLNAPGKRQSCQKTWISQSWCSWQGGSDFFVLRETHDNNNNNAPPSPFFTGHGLDDCDAGSEGWSQLGKWV